MRLLARSAGWVHVAAATASDGGSIVYSVDANAAAARGATIRIAGHTHTVSQRSGTFAGARR